MQLRNGVQTLDAYRPTFDPHLDIATVVFSHVQCVKTRVNLAVVSKLWRDASKPAAAYPDRFDFDAFPGMSDWTRSPRIIGLLDNDEALSLPYERVVGLLGETARSVCDYAAERGSLRLLKWTRENNLVWSASRALPQPIKDTCPLSSTCTRTGALGTRTRTFAQPQMGTCQLSSTCTRTGALGAQKRAGAQPKMDTYPLSSTCTRTGALGTRGRALAPPITNTGTACSTRWITSARGGRNTPRDTRSTSDEIPLIRSNTR